MQGGGRLLVLPAASMHLFCVCNSKNLRLIETSARIYFNWNYWRVIAYLHVPITLLAAELVCLTTNAIASPSLRLRAIGLLNLIGPAVGSAMPQFMTNWLGSYIPAAALLVVTLIPPTVVP